jgi:ribosomal protein S27AE
MEHEMKLPVACGLTQFPPGFCITWDGQEYRPAGLRGHVRRDGTETILVDWHTNCPTCGDGMLIATTLDFHDPRRRCDDCKAPGRKVKSERRAARKDFKKSADTFPAIHVVRGKSA